jgi:hypothetical protein
MSAALDRDKLAKILALLASPVDGEALAAARKAVEILGKAGLRPESLAQPAPASKAPRNGWTRAGLEFALTIERTSRLILEERVAHLQRQIAQLEADLDATLPLVDVAELVERYSRPGSLHRGLWKIYEARIRSGKVAPGIKIAIRKLAVEEERSRAARGAA